MQSVANSDSPGVSRPKLGVAVIASLYFLWCAYDPYQWHLIDGVNLVIHEAGHLIFSLLGEFMMIAGGSLFQVIMPAVFVGYFWYHSKYYSASLVLTQLETGTAPSPAKFPHWPLCRKLIPFSNHCGRGFPNGPFVKLITLSNHCGRGRPRSHWIGSGF